MTDSEWKDLVREASKQAHAIGYLRGISALLWNMGEDPSIKFSSDDAVYFDTQVDVLAHALAVGKEGA